MERKKSREKIKKYKKERRRRLQRTEKKDDKERKKNKGREYLFRLCIKRESPLYVQPVYQFG